MSSVAPVVVPLFGASAGFQLVSTGATITLRGVNAQAHNISSGALAKMSDIGGNICRVAIFWDKIEVLAPTGSGTNWSTYAHSYDVTALGKIDNLVNYCTAHGIMVLLDFHKVSSWSSYFNPLVPSSGQTAGIPGWYYSDARFPGAVAGYTQDSTGRATAQTGWYTGDADGQVNGFHCNQVFIEALWSFLINRYGTNPFVIMWGVFNEPSPGNLITNLGTRRAASTVINTWLTPIRDHILATDLLPGGSYSGRGISGFSGIGGHIGWGTQDYSPFGNAAAMQAAYMVLEPHSYYRGLEPGSDAGGTGSGFNALDAATDHNDYEYPDRSILTTVTADSTAGTQTGQNAFNEVFRANAVSLGLPILWGEWGVQTIDRARLQYMSQMQTYFDAHGLSCTYWALRNPDQGTMSLLTGAMALTDIAQSLQAWIAASGVVKPSRTYRVVKNVSNQIRVTLHA